MKNARFLTPLLLLLCAFQCGDPPDPDPHTSPLQPFILSVLPNVPEVYVGDTLWLSGSVSSRVLEYTSGDSLISCYIPDAVVSFYRLIVPLNKNDKNTVLAANEFDFYATIGQVEKEYCNWTGCEHWENLQRVLTPEFSTDSTHFELLTGIIPQSIGYFALSYHHEFKVENHNHDLYTMFGDPKSYSFFAEGRRSVFWANIDQRLYFFKVVNHE
jgi:hypothetical protein